MTSQIWEETHAVIFHLLRFNDLFYAQMMSERQRIEAAPAPTPSMDRVPTPPPYEEVIDVPTSPVQNGSTDSMGYFLGEVSSLAEVICCTYLNHLNHGCLTHTIVHCLYNRSCIHIKPNLTLSSICLLETMLSFERLVSLDWLLFLSISPDIYFCINCYLASHLASGQPRKNHSFEWIYDCAIPPLSNYSNSLLGSLFQFQLKKKKNYFTSVLNQSQLFF